MYRMISINTYIEKQKAYSIIFYNLKKINDNLWVGSICKLFVNFQFLSESFKLTLKFW